VWTTLEVKKNKFLSKGDGTYDRAQNETGRSPVSTFENATLEANESESDIRLRLNLDAKEEFDVGIQLEDTCVKTCVRIAKGTVVYSGDAIVSFRRPAFEGDAKVCGLEWRTRLLASITALPSNVRQQLLETLEPLYPHTEEELWHVLAHMHGYVPTAHTEALDEMASQIPYAVSAALVMNALPVSSGFGSAILSEVDFGVHLGASRFTHSCLPNCTFIYKGDLLVVTAHTDIEPKVECTIDYFSNGGDRTVHNVVTTADSKGEQRRAYILAERGFECACELCIRQLCELRLSKIVTSSSSPATVSSVCNACSNTLVKDSFLRCSQCRTVCYCDTACQKRHWRTHKKKCKSSMPFT
jgi:hypothetical protein